MFASGRARLGQKGAPFEKEYDPIIDDPDEDPPIGNPVNPDVPGPGGPGDDDDDDDDDNWEDGDQGPGEGGGETPPEGSEPDIGATFTFRKTRAHNAYQRIFLAADENRSAVSPTGLHWLEGDTSVPGAKRVASNGFEEVVWITSTNIYSSNDAGRTNPVDQGAFGTNLKDLDYGGGLFVAVGGKTVVYGSPLIGFQSYELSGLQGELVHIRWCNGMWVATATDGANDYAVYVDDPLAIEGEIPEWREVDTQTNFGVREFEGHISYPEALENTSPISIPFFAGDMSVEDVLTWYSVGDSAPVQDQDGRLTSVGPYSVRNGAPLPTENERFQSEYATITATFMAECSAGVDFSGRISVGSQSWLVADPETAGQEDPHLAITDLGQWYSTEPEGVLTLAHETTHLEEAAHDASGSGGSFASDPTATFWSEDWFTGASPQGATDMRLRFIGRNHDRLEVGYTQDGSTSSHNGEIFYHFQTDILNGDADFDISFWNDARTERKTVRTQIYLENFDTGDLIEALTVGADGGEVEFVPENPENWTQNEDRWHCNVNNQAAAFVVKDAKSFQVMMRKKNNSGSSAFRYFFVKPGKLIDSTAKSNLVATLDMGPDDAGRKTFRGEGFKPVEPVRDPVDGEMELFTRDDTGVGTYEYNTGGGEEVSPTTQTILDANQNGSSSSRMSYFLNTVMRAGLQEWFPGTASLEKVSGGVNLIASETGAVFIMRATQTGVVGQGVSVLGDFAAGDTLRITRMAGFFVYVSPENGGNWSNSGDTWTCLSGTAEKVNLIFTGGYSVLNFYVGLTNRTSMTLSGQKPASLLPPPEWEPFALELVGDPVEGVGDPGGQQLRLDFTPSEGADPDEIFTIIPEGEERHWLVQSNWTEHGGKDFGPLQTSSADVEEEFSVYSSGGVINGSGDFVPSKYVRLRLDGDAGVAFDDVTFQGTFEDAPVADEASGQVFTPSSYGIVYESQDLEAFNRKFEREFIQGNWQSFMYDADKEIFAASSNDPQNSLSVSYDDGRSWQPVSVPEAPNGIYKITRAGWKYVCLSLQQPSTGLTYVHPSDRIDVFLKHGALSFMPHSFVDLESDFSDVTPADYEDEWTGAPLVDDGSGNAVFAEGLPDWVRVFYSHNFLNPGTPFVWERSIEPTHWWEETITEVV